ncbi:MAG: NAD(P)H-hydrate epimerase, partial [Bacteroidetes bacterium]|nr:NAD(P)H-hydrate epimerase [Bacteroidota bacterium]
MKIVDVNQIREIDKFTIEHEPISSIDLMERASTSCVNWLTEQFDTKTTFTIFCGLGNNGGDGLAIARLLSERNFKVNIFITRYSEIQSENFKINLQRLSAIETIVIQEINIISDLHLKPFNEGEKTEVIIDSIFGSGLNKPIDGLITDVISFINQQPSPVISIDIPSGLYCDKLNSVTDFIVKANFTLTFQFPKLSFMFPEVAQYIGEFTVFDIGLHRDHINHTQTKNYFITKNDVRVFLKTRSKIAHKGIFGHALIVAGAYGKIGAAVLAAKGCLRAGVGLLTIHIPKIGYEI